MNGITVTKHDCDEWSRMATAAYAADRNDIGHRYSMAATVGDGARVNTAWYDRIQAGYRAWLVSGEWPVLA